MADVFVSYSHEDRDAAQAIVDAVASAGVDVFRAHSTDGGAFDPGQVREQFNSARCVICLWSQHAARSAFMQEEVQHAIRAWAEGRLVLATLDDAPLPVGLRDLQGIPVRMGPDGIDATELVAEVQAIVGPSGRFGNVAPAPRDAPPMAPAAEAATPPTVAPLARRGMMPLVAVLALLVSAGMTLSWISGDFEPRRRAGMGMGGMGKTAAPMPDVAKPDVAKPFPQQPSMPPPQRPPQTAEVPQPSPPSAAPPPSMAPAPVPQPPLPDTAPQPADGIPVLLVMLIVGVAIGAGSVWAWSKWSRTTAGGVRPTAADTPQPAAAIPAEPAHLVFVSYSRQDGRAVEDLVKQIEQAGYTVWIDRHSTGSQRYAAPIVRAIKTSRLVALMCSQNAFTSDHVIREVYVAGDYKKPFIAFQLDRSEFPDDVQYFVSGFPRVPIDALDAQQLRSELARLVAA